MVRLERQVLHHHGGVLWAVFFLLNHMILNRKLYDSNADCSFVKTPKLRNNSGNNEGDAG
jgi:hypothetical protein